MLYAEPETWAEWSTANTDVDMPEVTKLAALRGYIAATARKWVHDCTYDAAWANKKFAKLGMADRIGQENYYTVTATVTGTAQVGVYANSRAEALEKANARLSDRDPLISSISVTSDPVFTSGPEDSAPVNPDGPQTVDATLTMLREIILLGHISGPKVCQVEADRVLASFGLAPIPERKTFTVAVPVEAVMKTTVEAYDEASASRVAGWRWDNDRTGYTVDHVTGEHPAQVVPIAA
jgi:hypothetical protein